MTNAVPRALLLAATIAVPQLGVAADLAIQPAPEGVWAIVGKKGAAQPRKPSEQCHLRAGGDAAGRGADRSRPIVEGRRGAGCRIRSVTDAPVVFVIDTGGQDHRRLGNGYWQAKGAKVIASAAAVEDHKARGSMQLSGLSILIGDGLAGTEPAYADTAFDDHYALEPGGVTLDIVPPGGARTPGDSFVRAPAQATVFTADIVYVARILGARDQSSIGQWPAAFEALDATGAAHMAPGHGHATTMATAHA